VGVGVGVGGGASVTTPGLSTGPRSRRNGRFEVAMRHLGPRKSHRRHTSRLGRHVLIRHSYMSSVLHFLMLLHTAAAHQHQH
jgi:hypothetical protein